MKIVIVGAGLAGSAAASMLSLDGHDVTVVDAAPTPAEGGYLILLDDTALRLLGSIGARTLALDTSIPAPRITIRRGTRNLTAFDPTGYRLARRGALIGGLTRNVATTVPTHLGRRLTGITQHQDHISAHFTDGTHHDADLLVGADGLNSTVRRLAIDPTDAPVFTNGRTHHWVRVPGQLVHPSGAAVLLVGGRQAQVFPYPDRTHMLVATVLRTGDAAHDRADLLPLTVDLLRRGGPDFAQLADAAAHVDPGTTRLTRFAQVRTGRWHGPRVVLVGDAAHCIDPLSGLGAHGALLGAARLTEELRATPHDPTGASQRYTRRMRAFTSTTQRLTAGLVSMTTRSHVSNSVARG